MAAFIGALFLVFFLAAFMPWLLANGMTAAVEGLMHQVGFNDFAAETLGDWILVLLVGALFTAFIVVIAVSILALYNLISQRTGLSMRAIQKGELAPPIDRPAIAEPVDDPDDDRTFDDLYAEAKRKKVPGRSSMSKVELEAVLKPKRPRAARSTTARR